MASNEVTGWLQHEIAEKKDNWTADTPFNERFCLSKIPVQPDDYDGPPRYCMNARTKEVGDGKFHCKHHGGNGGDAGSRLDDKYIGAPNNMKSGMKATVEHLKEDFDDKDEALYKWIVEQYPEKYDIDLEANPGLLYDVHRLAAEIVRAERGRGQLIEEGEVREIELTDEDGRVVTDPQTGEVKTKKSQHYLADMMARQDSKITQLEKELGITRKEQRKADQTEDAIGTMKDFMEIGSAFIDRDGQEYDPDNQPWKSDDDNSE